MTVSPAQITWRPGISDPGALAWAITSVYLAAGVVCLLRTRDRGLARRLLVFWAVAGSLFIFLAINKQMDFQVLLIQLGRTWATSHHWLERRRGVQAVFAALLSGGTVIAALASVRLLRSSWSTVRMPLLGLACTLSVVLLGAAMICHVFDWLYPMLGTTASTVHHGMEPLELIGPSCVIGWAWRSRRTAQTAEDRATDCRDR